MTRSESGREIGVRHVETLQAYLERLRAVGEALPTRNGRLNLSAIAIACGFDRQTLYKNSAAKTLLQEAVDVLGLAQPQEEPAEALEATPKTDGRDRRILQLEQHNAALRAEIRGLREQLARYRHIEAVMVSGRGVRS